MPLLAPHTVTSAARRTSRSRRRRLAAVAAPLVIAIAVIGGIACGDGKGDERVLVDEPTQGPTATPAPPTPSVEDVLRYFAAILPTATPEPRATGGGGGGAPAPTGGGSTYVPPRSTGTGPGPITGTNMTITSASAGLNANVSARSVGTNGQMGDPSGAWMVVWYDFSQNWPGLGGLPGQPGANAVFAGHVDYIRVGPAVFWGVRNMQAGDQVTVNTPEGPITYVIQWSQSVPGSADFTSYVAQTGEELITLVTCIGEFSAGHYSSRIIVRGKRV